MFRVLANRLGRSSERTHLVTHANSIYSGQRFEDVWLDN